MDEQDRWDADWEFAQAGLKEEARLHLAGICPKDPLRCYTCYVEELERQPNAPETQVTGDRFGAPT